MPHSSHKSLQQIHKKPKEKESKYAITNNQQPSIAKRKKGNKRQKTVNKMASVTPQLSKINLNIS